MAYSSSSSFSSSSQYRFLPFFAISVAFLLMASNYGSALVCYNNLSDDDELLGGCPAASEVFANGGNGGNGTMHCPAGYEHCLTHHCRARYGVDKTLKNCGRYVGGATTGEASCNFIRDKEFCGDDPKYYCRYCDTDLCNNEPDE